MVTRVHTLHLDGLGSVRAVTDEAGLARERTAFRPYGEEVAALQPLSLPETKGFIGERFDDTSGLQYLNARYYDPKLGMFVQPDWWEVTKEGVGTNRYSYSFGDPVNGRDPTGHTTFGEAVRDFFEGIGRALGGLFEGDGRSQRTSGPGGAGGSMSFDVTVAGTAMKMTFPNWGSVVKDPTIGEFYKQPEKLAAIAARTLVMGGFTSTDPKEVKEIAGWVVLDTKTQAMSVHYSTDPRNKARQSYVGPQPKLNGTEIAMHFHTHPGSVSIRGNKAAFGVTHPSTPTGTDLRDIGAAAQYEPGVVIGNYVDRSTLRPARIDIWGYDQNYTLEDFRAHTSSDNC